MPRAAPGCARTAPTGWSRCRRAAAGSPHPDALDGSEGTVTELAAGRRWAVAADGFWQVHPAAADTLVEAVLAGLRPEPGERALDLYCGVGLFAGVLADAGCRVWAWRATTPRSSTPGATWPTLPTG